MISGTSFGSASIHVGDDWHVRCCTYPATMPILSISGGTGGFSVSITPQDQMPAEAVAFARELARQAAAFAADCERLHAAQHTSPSATDSAA